MQVGRVLCSGDVVALISGTAALSVRLSSSSARSGWLGGRETGTAASGDVTVVDMRTAGGEVSSDLPPSIHKSNANHKFYQNMNASDVRS